MIVTINDINLYYEKYGDKKQNILIIPGWGDNRLTFNYIINFLKEYFTVYIIDLPGFGKSIFPNRCLTIHDYGNLINDFIKIVEIDNPILIGHSFGGRVIGILCGKLGFKPKKILLMASAGIKLKKPILVRFKIKLFKFLKTIKLLLPKKTQAKYINYLNKLFGSSDYKNLSENMKKTFVNVVNEDLSTYFKNIKQETLLIWGDQDIDTNLKEGIIIKNLIINSELIVLKNKGHFFYLEDVHLTNNIIYEYLKEDINH